MNKIPQESIGPDPIERKMVIDVIAVLKTVKNDPSALCNLETNMTLFPPSAQKLIKEHLRRNKIR